MTRAYAAASLRYIGNREAFEALIDALDDPDIAVNANAWAAMRDGLNLAVESDAHTAGIMTLAEFREVCRTALVSLEEGLGRVPSPV